MRTLGPATVILITCRSVWPSKPSTDQLGPLSAVPGVGRCIAAPHAAVHAAAPASAAAAGTIAAITATAALNATAHLGDFIRNIPWSFAD
ncbi:hypothetical protein GCM10010149_37610 [Nonomuraea roseoviolacea subsp. roseoviolacea]